MNDALVSQQVYLYEGSLVCSADDNVQKAKVTVEFLTVRLIKVSFESVLGSFVFRAMISDYDEGDLIVIQGSTRKEYILIGKPGFVCSRPHVHGGFVNLLESYYFNIQVEFYNGSSYELFFLGKPLAAA